MAGTQRWFTTPMDIHNTIGTTDVLQAFEEVVSSLLEDDVMMAIVMKLSRYILISGQIRHVKD